MPYYPNNMAEFPPISVDGLADKLNQLFEADPGARRMVVLSDDQEQEVGQFGISVVNEGGKYFFQIENVQPVELGVAFAELDVDKGKNSIGGIYRIPFRPKPR